MSDWLLIAPLLFPPIGALALSVKSPKEVGVRFPILLLLVEILFILANIATAPHSLVLSSWDLASFSLVLEIDGLAIVLLLIMVVPLLALWLVAQPKAPFNLWSALLFSTAVLMTTAMSLEAVYFSWVLMDGVILVWRLSRVQDRPVALRAFVTSQLAGFILLGGELLSGTDLSGLGGILFAIAFWARLGLFPFHWILPRGNLRTDELWIMWALPLIAGSSLWLRWRTLHLDPPSFWISVLAVAALIVSAIWAWAKEPSPDSTRTASAQSIIFVPLAIAFGNDAGTCLALWMVLGTAMGIAFLALAETWPEGPSSIWCKVSWFAGFFSIAHVPFTPAFLGRLALYIALWEKSQFVLLSIAAATTWVGQIALLNKRPNPASEKSARPQKAQFGGLVLLDLVFLALGLGAVIYTPILAPYMSNSTQSAINLAIWTDDLVGVLSGVAFLAVPMLAAFALAPMARRHSLPIATVTGGLNWLANLDWLGSALAAVGYEMGRAARNLSSIVEENPIVWIMLVALWAAIFILIPR